MEATKPALYQPNVITQARYIFSEQEMKVLIFIIRSIQGLFNKDDVQVNRTLFGEVDYKIFFYLSEIKESETNLTRIKKAIKDLRKKDFEIHDEKRWLNVGLINYGEYNYEAKKWEIQVSHKLMPYMVSMARGFTAYQLETILHLNTHSQRLYMMFSQYHDTGIFRISAEDLRYKLGLESKYETYANFKNRVLSAAEKELKQLFDAGKSDLWVKLEKDKKERGKEDFDRTLTFKIFYSERKFNQIEEAKAEAMRYCARMLNAMLPEADLYCNKLLGYLVEQKRLKPFSDRLERLEDQAREEVKPLTSYGGLLRHIAKEDFKYQG
jgi:plasmid replication initiation protein